MPPDPPPALPPSPPTSEAGDGVTDPDEGMRELPIEVEGEESEVEGESEDTKGRKPKWVRMTVRFVRASADEIKLVSRGTSKGDRGGSSSQGGGQGSSSDARTSGGGRRGPAPMTATEARLGGGDTLRGPSAVRDHCPCFGVGYGVDSVGFDEVHAIAKFPQSGESSKCTIANRGRAACRPTAFTGLFVTSLVTSLVSSF